VQLHVAVAGGVLQPVRHRQAGLVPLAGLPAVHPRVVRPGPGVARLPLEVVKAGPDGLPDHLIDLGGQGRPVLISRCITCLAGQTDVLAKGGVEDRDGLRQRNRQVEKERALPGLPGGLKAQLMPALGGGMRLGGQEPGVQVRGFPAVGPEACPAGCRPGLCAGRTAGHTLRVRPPGPAPGRAPWRPGPTSGQAALPRSRWPGCSTRPRPWPGRGPPASRRTPGRSPCSGSRQPPPANPPPAGAAELTAIVMWCGPKRSWKTEKRSRLKGDKTADQDQKREAY